MPYPNEHACRLRDPGAFKEGSFRRMSRESDGRRYDVIMGRLKGEDTLTEQAYRYAKDEWSVPEARAHCEEHDGMSFEAAVEEKAANRTGVMVALFPSANLARKLAVDGGEEPANLHITLAYLGDVEDAPDAEGLLAAVQEFAGSEAPLSGRISGVGRFSNVDEDGRQSFYASVDLPGLPKFRERLVDALAAAGFVPNAKHGFTPHMTLAYVDKNSADPSTDTGLIPIRVPSIYVCHGERRWRVGLGTGEAPRLIDVRKEGREAMEEFNESDVKADVRKTEEGVAFPPEDYAYVPDPESPSTWKLRLAETPGKLTVIQVARAITALQPGGFRGQRVEIPSGDKPGVIRKIASAIGRIPDADDVQRENLRDRLNAVKAGKSFDAAVFWKSLFDPDVDEDALGEGGPAEAEKAGRRLNKGMLEHVRSLIEELKAFLGWANYEDEPEKSPAAEDVRQLLRQPGGRNFKVFKARDGSTRWLSFSANAFKDREHEIFATKALEEAVEYAERSGQRGPLLLWHVPTAEIGQCDFQAVIGRFLAESGTFHGTALGRRARDYFDAHPDEAFGMSIGYQYRQGDKGDGVYDWVRIFERSVLPAQVAANAWTKFGLHGGDMKQEQKDFLESILGREEAAKVIAEAEDQTKALEENVAFKGGDGASPGAEKANADLAEAMSTLTMLVGKVGDADLKKQFEGALAKIKEAGVGAGEPKAKKEGDGPEEKATDAGGEDASKSADGSEASDALVQLMADAVQKGTGPIAEAIGQVQAQVASLNEWRETVDAGLKALQEADEQKLDKAVGDAVRPRAIGPGTAASASEDNVADDETTRQLKSGTEGTKNPAGPYVEDLVGAEQAQ